MTSSKCSAPLSVHLLLVSFVGSFGLAACGSSPAKAPADAAPPSGDTAMNGAPDASSTDAATTDAAPSDAAPTRDATEPTDIPAPTMSGTWIDVTPANANLTDALDCGNYGSTSVGVDPAHPSNLYTELNCQGIWKSTDYGASWTGPINTGTNGAAVGDCAGGITVTAGSGNAPTIYEACIRGTGAATNNGFWKSVDGGVNWTPVTVGIKTAAQYYAPVVDPYDKSHLVMSAHEDDPVAETTDGGMTWTNIAIASGMKQNGGTAAIFFIDTGNAATTRKTFLWMGQASGGMYGTWRSTDGGVTWTQVDKNEHAHGGSQAYQPDTKGAVYIAGVYSDHGWGVLRSGDYGATWEHLGGTGGETLVFGTAKNIYAMSGGAVGIGNINDPNFELAAQPGTGTWAMPSTPAAMNQGGAQVAVVNDGTHNILVGAMWNTGIWRYIEP